MVVGCGCRRQAIDWSPLGSSPTDEISLEPIERVVMFEGRSIKIIEPVCGFRTMSIWCNA